MDMTIFDKCLDFGKTFMSGIFSVLDKCIEDKNLATKIKGEIATQINSQAFDIQIQILKNEAASNSKFVQYWRPGMCWAITLMLSLYGIWNFFGFPILTMIKTGEIVRLTMDWDFVAICGGISGCYIIGRSSEKITDIKVSSNKDK